MSFKIIVDSCCDLTPAQLREGCFVSVPLTIHVGGQDIVDDDGELIILEVTEEDGEEVLGPIENDQLFDNIAAIFEDRLADLFEIEEADEQ